MQKVTSERIFNVLLYTIPTLSLCYYFQKVWMEVYGVKYIYGAFAENFGFVIILTLLYLKNYFLSKLKLESQLLKNSGFILILAFFVINAADPIRFLYNPVFQITTIYFLGTLVRGFTGRLGLPVPLWLSGIMALMILYVIVLYLGFYGLFGIAANYATLFSSFAVSVLFFRKTMKTDWLSFKSISPSDIFWAECVFLLCTLVVVAGQAPEYVFDSARYYLSFARRIAETGWLTENPYSFMENLSWVTQTLMALGHSLDPESGTKFYAGPISFIILNLMIVDFIKNECRLSLKTGLIAAILFSITPHIFNYAGTAYYDLSGAVASFACFYLFKKGVEGRFQYIYLLVPLFVFSYLIKLFSIFVCVVGFSILLCFYRERIAFLKNCFRKTLPLIGILAVTCLVFMPRFYLTFRGTGDPFFPILSEKLDYQRWHGLKDVLLPGKDFFHYAHNFFTDMLLFPFFATVWSDNFIDENPAGVLGALLLGFYYVPFIILFKRDNIKKIRLNTNDPIFYFVVFLSLVIFIAILHAPHLRYWYSAYLFLLIFVVLAVEKYLREKTKLKYYFQFLIAVSIILQVPFISYYPGIETRKALPPDRYSGTFSHYPGLKNQKWFPWQVHTGNLSADSFAKTSEWYDAVRFLNKINGGKDTVLTTLFYNHYDVSAQVIDSTPWWDPFNNLKDVEQFQTAITVKKVKYWIVGKKPEVLYGIYVEKGIAARFWKKENLVFDDAYFSVYKL